MKKDTKLILIVLAGILAIVLLCIFAVQGTQNKAFTLEEQVNTAQSDIRVQEKRRVDLVYNLADCVLVFAKSRASSDIFIFGNSGAMLSMPALFVAATPVDKSGRFMGSSNSEMMFVGLTHHPSSFAMKKMPCFVR